MEACATCAQIDLGLSNRENGRRLGVAESSIRRHKAHMGEQKDSFFDIPNEIITSRGKTVRLEDGSYEKVSWQPARKALLDSLSYDDLERAIAGFDYTPAKHYGNNAAAVLNVADLQIGKAQQRGGGSPETVFRAQQSIKAFAERISLTKPEHVVIVDNGDPIENIFNVPGQLITNDLDVPTQIRTFRRLMIDALKVLAPLAPNLTYLAVPSNHGASRSTYKQQAGTTDADFGLEISHQLEDVCVESRSLQDVRFVRPEALYETATLEVANTKLAFHHGHQTNGQNGHSKWWAGQDHGRMPGWDADILVVAHYHNLRIEQSGDERWIIGVSSGEPSSDYYTNRTGESSKRGMTAFDVLDGQWSDLEIL